MNRAIYNVAFIIFISLLESPIFAQSNLVSSRQFYDAIHKQTLVLNADGTYVLINNKERVLLHYIDTLSFGKWEEEGNFFVLNSHKRIENQELKVSVIEEYQENFDSLKILIENPYEDYLVSNGGSRLFSYIFSIISYEDKFGPGVVMENNSMTIPKSEVNKLVYFFITIVVDAHAYPETLAFNYLNTEMYQFKNRSANIIKINIPELRFEYIGYKRFRSEYVRIYKKGVLLNGCFFKKINNP